MEAKQIVIDFIESKIRSSEKSEQIVFELTELFMSCDKVNFDKDFMSEICRYFLAKGFYMKYCYHLSFIWRHKIIISKKPIKNYLPHEEYQCGWFATEKERIEFQKEAKAFMESFEKNVIGLGEVAEPEAKLEHKTLK